MGFWLSGQGDFDPMSVLYVRQVWFFWQAPLTAQGDYIIMKEGLGMVCHLHAKLITMVLR